MKQQKSKFTKDELFEIEKMFDGHAHQALVFVGSVAKSIGMEHPLAKRTLEEGQKDFDMFRSISSKCRIMSDRCENEK